MIPKILGLPLLKVAIRFEPDIVTARQKTRRISQLLGFDNQDQARFATAVSELARNVFQYATSGTVEFFFHERSPQTLYIKVTDAGPGISNLQEIFNGNYISKNGMGVGLMGTKKLMDQFHIDSSPEKGTSIIIGKSLDSRARQVTTENLKFLSEQLVLKQAENPFEEIRNQNRELLNALEQVQSAKEELTSLNQELAETNRGVVALYAELDEKAFSLQRANDVKTRFLSNMTHEFRTPLSSVISLTRLLLSGIDGPLSPEQEKQVHYIRKSSEGLLELVNDLLDLAKVEAGKVSINSAEFSIEEILGGLRGTFRPILSNSDEVKLHVDFVSPFELNTDQAKLAQILRNLVSNAVKYTEHGTITVTTKLESNDQVHFTVSDTGIGIHSELLNLIFEDFSQIESPLQKKQKGTGLGLPLSRKLARLLGGDLWAESSVGQGSIFHVSVPRVYSGLDEAVLISHISSEADNKEITSIKDQSTNPLSSNFRVLLIDDNEPSRYVLRQLVSKEIDADFSEVDNGKSGMNVIKAWHPDVVFLDLSMPDVDGFEVLKQIRIDQKLKNLPVIINTAKKLNDQETEYLSKAATAVLSKDRVNHQESVVALRNALGRAGFDYKTK